MALLAPFTDMNRSTLALLLAGLSAPCTLLAAPPEASPRAKSPYQLSLAEKADYRLGAAHSGSRMAAAGRQDTPLALGKKPFAKEIEQAARRSNLDPALVHAVIHVESGYQAQAVSPKGAVGLMQVLPKTAERFGVLQAASPEANLAAGTRYLRTLLDLFDQRLDLALAAYNAGEGAVVRHGNRIPPYRETRDYVPSVMEKYKEWLGTGPSATRYLPGTRLDPRAIALLPAD